jgi:hypothetical protein
MKNFEFGDAVAGKGIFTEGRKGRSGLCCAVVLCLRCNLVRAADSDRPVRCGCTELRSVLSAVIVRFG